MRPIPNGKRDTPTDFVLGQAVRGSEVRTDGWTDYDHIGRYRFTNGIKERRPCGRLTCRS